MIRANTLALLLGDFTVFVGALFVALAIRYQEWPEQAIIEQHLSAFWGIFVIWLAVFLIAGLYDPHTSISRKRIPDLVLKVQIVNTLIAALIFFLFSTGITPKTTLALYLLVSTALIVLWRLFVFPFLAARQAERLLIIGTSGEAMAMKKIFEGAPYYRFVDTDLFDPAPYTDERSLQSALLSEIDTKKVTLIAGDMHGERKELVSVLYAVSLTRHEVAFIGLHQLYEELFHRIPPSLIKDSWVLENVSRAPHRIYDALKRAFDIALALALSIVLLPLFPIIGLLIKLEDGGPIFYGTERVGRFGIPIRILKFRSMNGQDKGEEALKSTLTVTKIGKFLRVTRLDEIPQLINVLRGDLSFIGPRPEMPALAEVYAKEIPYYNMRHLIKPGLSGWAQIYHEGHPHHGTNVAETVNKLSYDLYYLKQRSLWLDLEIALKTIKTLLSRSGT